MLTDLTAAPKLGSSMNPDAHPHPLGRTLAIMTVAVLAVGCAPLQPRIDEVTLYVLAAEPAHTAQLPRRDIVIEVAFPRAWPGTDTAQIAYVRKPYELDYFAASRWADTPARMLGPLLARALEQTGSFSAVIQTSTAVRADYRLDTEIVRLRQDFGAQPSRVELALRAQLSDIRGKRVVASRRFEEIENAPSEDAAGGVAAANAALGRALERIAAFCVAESQGR
jgi:cholesterol transport system auxiliary component